MTSSAEWLREAQIECDRLLLDGGPGSDWWLGRRSLGIRLCGRACKLAHPEGKRCKDDQSNSTPRPSDVASADNEIYREEDAKQVSEGHQAEDNAGEAQTAGWGF